MDLNEMLARHHSPSFLTTLKFCPRAHFIRYGRELEPIGRLDDKMLWGRMYHRAVQDIDQGEDPVKGLEDEGQAIRLQPTYLSSDSLLIDRVQEEVVKEALPVYRKYVTGPVAALWRTVDVETEIYAIVDDLKVKCIPDKIVEYDDELWVVERKTTSRDDKKWLRQWGLNFQTTLEVVVAEAHYERPVKGVWIEQVLVTRKRAKNRDPVEELAGLPQRIHRIECSSPRPVDKTPFVKREAIEFVRGCVEELKWRHRTGRENDPNYTNCQRCSLHDMCKGKVTADQFLVKRAPR
jgi:hypothetical protein